MNNMRCLLFLVLLGCFFINGLSAAPARAEDLTPLLNKISNRIDSYPEHNNIQYKMIKKYSEIDKKGRPKKTTVTKTIIRVVDSIYSSEVLEAVLTEDGVTKDIKQGTIERTKKQDERRKKTRAEKKDQNKTVNPFILFFPFHENKRTRFEFKRLNDDTYNERPVFIIKATPKEKDKDLSLSEGEYYIDQKTYDVLKVWIKPSNIPILIKEADMVFEFQVLPEGHFMIKRMKASANAGLLFMRIRAIQEEEYSDVKILN